MALSDRYISAKKGAIVRLREAKGWDQTMLAAKATISQKTLSSIENGERGQFCTLRKIAKALEVEPGELIQGAEVAPSPVAEQPPESKGYVEVTFKFFINFSDFDETANLLEILNLIRSLIQLKGEIVVSDVRNGSVLIDLRFSEEDDFISLVVHFCPVWLTRSLAANKPLDFSHTLSELGTGHFPDEWLNFEPNQGNLGEHSDGLPPWGYIGSYLFMVIKYQTIRGH